MKKGLLGLLLSIAVLFAKAQNPLYYLALGIPDSLLKDAGVVTRFESRVFDIDATDDASYKFHGIYTVLSERGKRALFFAQRTDKFRKLDDAEIKVYNALGTKLNTYKKKEMFSQAYGDGLVEDGSYTWFSVSAPTYPITVELEYTLKFKGLLEYPDYIIQLPYESVQESIYTITAPPELLPRYLVINSTIKPSISAEGKKTKLEFKASNLQAKHYEDESGGMERYFPKVYISPQKFKMADYEGDMSSWKTFGLWSYNLIGNSNQLSDENKATIQQVVGGAASVKEKTQKLYAYLQKNMRYVSIQLGIGGWKPFPADFVFKKKYGDCKALSNFMQAALAAVGVKSYYTLINAEENGLPVKPEFATSEFNHVILCVPDGKDSIWLECTSSTKDFNRLGYATENRNALLITENGGILVNTPKSKAQNNVESITSNIYLNEDGGAKTSSSLQATGHFKDQAVYYINQKTEDEKREFVVKGLEWKQPDELKISHGDRELSPYNANIEALYEKLMMTKAGSKMFIPSCLYNFFDEDVPLEKRKYDYFFSGPYIKYDTSSFHLPKGYIPEQLPEDKNLATPFAKYSCTTKFDAATGTVQIMRMLEISVAQIKAEQYATLCEFKANVDASVKSKLVIKQQ